MIEYLSFGGGSPSMALAILNAEGKVEPRAEFAVFADTGWERQETYRVTDLMGEWLAEQGIEMVTVQAPEGPLDQHCLTRGAHVPLPVRVDGGGQAPRECTDRWKIRIIRGYVSRRCGRGTPQTVQLGLHYGEIHRMRDPKVKRDRNRWPLIELKLNRADCDRIVREAGFPVPPRSACVGCPFTSRAGWMRLAAEAPEDFERACVVDDYLETVAQDHDLPALYLSGDGRRLRRTVSTGQLVMLRGADMEMPCDSGYCWT